MEFLERVVYSAVMDFVQIVLLIIKFVLHAKMDMDLQETEHAHLV